MPDDRRLFYWNMFMVLLLAYCATYLPFVIVFHPPYTGPGESIQDKVDNYIDMFFLTDMFINFISAYDDPETLLPEIRPKVIAANYISGYFFIDLLAILPFQYLDGSKDKSLKLAKIARLPRLYRLLRIVRMIKLLKAFKKDAQLVGFIDSFNISVQA